MKQSKEQRSGKVSQTSIKLFLMTEVEICYHLKLYAVNGQCLSNLNNIPLTEHLRSLNRIIIYCFDYHEFFQLSDYFQHSS